MPGTWRAVSTARRFTSSVRASEAPEGLALLDAAHWATEWPWLADAARRLSAATTVETVVSTLVTDPWTHDGLARVTPLETHFALIITEGAA